MADQVPPQGHSKTAIAIQIAGIVGILLCVAFIVAVWLAHGQIASGIDQVTATVDGGFDRALTKASDVQTRLDAAAARVGEIATDATQVSAGLVAPAAVTRLQERVGTFGDNYRQLRVAYAEARGNVEGAVTSLQQVARFVPAIEAPRAVGALQTLDASFQQLDQSVSAIAEAGATVTTARATVTARAASAIQGVIGQASAQVETLSQDITGARAQAAGAASTIRTIVLLSALAITALAVWILLLNYALWRLGRTYPRTAPAVTGSPPPASDPPGPPGSPPPASDQPEPGSAPPAA